MMIFLMASVTLLTLTLLTRPLWQKQLSSLTLQASAAPSLHTQENVEAYRARALELELALQAGRITAIEKQDLDIELKRTLLTDAALTQHSLPPGTLLPGSLPQGSLKEAPSSLAASLPVDSGPQWKTVVIMALLLVLFTAAGYWHFGDYQQARAWQQTQQRLQPQIDKALADPQVLLELFKAETTRDVILSYQQSLLRSPDNPIAWQAQSRILQNLEHNSMAQQAARKAYQQAPQEPLYALELAQLIIEANQGKLSAESEHILKALQKDFPQDPRVLMLLGAAYLKSADWPLALSAFQALQAQLADVDMGVQGPLVKQKVADYITQSQQGLDAANSQANDAASNTANNTVNDAVKDQGAAAQVDVEASATATAVNLKVLVSIAPTAMSAWKGTETLWVFAKVADGPRFPVAAKKMIPSQWPVEITLSDADAMMPQYKLSAFPQVNITARLSEHDSVMGSQPGDWQQTLDSIDPRQTKPVELMLDAPKL